MHIREATLGSSSEFTLEASSFPSSNHYFSQDPWERYMPKQQGQRESKQYFSFRLVGPYGLVCQGSAGCVGIIIDNTFFTPKVYQFWL